ncbi:hypothetical protein DFH09DRAFT_1076855 [Mycena vulgaris]|nr:hypothetical protein DFH09DRAFT_1076855 [Mycena vulgaris]
MPKRIPTPEPGDDEPKYFTVVQPYPLNANLGITPRLYHIWTLDRWLHRDYPHPERLLGEHRWSEFLRKPSVEEAGRVSQIFYCVYSTGRQAQKDGWKRINVSDSWFKNWSPENPIIQNPYPATSWCPLPAEDRTNKPMCRPLPVRVKPPPPPKAAAAPVVPGSATWANAKGAPSQNTPATLRGGWAAARPGASNAAATKNTKAKGAPKSSAAPWHTATAPKSNNIVPVANALPAFPPGLGPLPGASDFDFPAPPGINRDASHASSASSSGAVLPVIAAAQYDHVRGVTEGFVSISLSPSQEAHLYGGGAETSPDPNAYVADWEKMPAPDVDSLWGYKAQKEEVVESLWGDDDDAEKKKKADAILCTVHGIICKKGICKEYARMLREKERAERDAASRGGGGGGGWNKANGGNKGNKGNKGNTNNGGRKTSNSNTGGKSGSPWKDDDSSSATGSEGRSPAPKATNDGWATVRGR